MEHHTAPPNPFPIKKLYGPPFYWIKANAATHEDGTLFLIAYRACNYSSGRGSKKVLEENVRKRIAPTHNATVRGLQGGNKHFWNIENSHPGDGSAISPRQLDTIIVATRVFVDHFGLVSEQVISHAEWTRRKIDPFWNGSNRTAIMQIRSGVEQGDEDMDQVGKAVVDIAFDMGWAAGDRTYWYGKDNNDPELEDLRAAIREGAAADRKAIDEGGGGGGDLSRGDTVVLK